MKSNPSGISLIVPVFNEAEGIGRVLEQVNGTAKPDVSEIIVVDDGSTMGPT
jgi:glycosyltransferase involved in cell wall biosynthesis